MAAVLVCLAGSLRAAASDARFTIRTRVAHAPARIDWSVAHAGEWDVTVGYDAARCEVYCAYRLKRDEFDRPRLTGLLVPPIAAIRVYADSASAPETVIIDPGGLEQPELMGRAVPAVESVYLPGRRLDGNAVSPAGDAAGPAARLPVPVSPAGITPVAVKATLPLRI